MYARHPQGHLELELGDWMWNRRLVCHFLLCFFFFSYVLVDMLSCFDVRYRLVAVDHDLVSFTDTSLHQWPLVLITNPKPAQFVIPHAEPLDRMALSSHVR